MRNRSNDATESQKEKKAFFNTHFSTVSQKRITGVFKM